MSAQYKSLPTSSSSPRNTVILEIEDEIDVSEEDEIYKQMVILVQGLAKSLIDNDIDTIILAWLKFRLEQSDAPIKRLGELFQIIMHYDMTFEIAYSNFILFKGAPVITHIPLSELSNETRKYFKALLTTPPLFFSYIDGFVPQYSTFSGFKLMNTFLNTGIWNRIAGSYISILTNDSINLMYLQGTAHQLLIMFVQDEIVYSYENYIKQITLSKSSISQRVNDLNQKEWVSKREKYLLNLKTIYSDLLTEIQPSDDE